MQAFMKNAMTILFAIGALALLTLPVIGIATIVVKFFWLWIKLCWGLI
jgi:hypothetical protein